MRRSARATVSRSSSSSPRADAAPQSLPEIAQPCARIDACARRRQSALLWCRAGRGRFTQCLHDTRTEEATTRTVDVRVSVARLLGDVKAQWANQLELRARPRHRHVQEAALLLDLRGLSARELRRKTAVGHVEHEHRVPLLALG